MADLMPARAGVDGDKTPTASRTTDSFVDVDSNPRRGCRVFPSADLAVAHVARQYGRPSTIWTYTDAEGQPVGLVLRWDRPNGGKTIRPVSRNGDGWMIGAMAEPRPLYRLPDLANAKRVYVCEGEKAAEAAWSIGLIATTSAQGCKSAHKTDWTPLAGKEVIILPDNDEAGREYADTVARILGSLTPKPDVKIVNLPEVPEGGDIVEFIDARDGNVDETRAAIEALADAEEPIEFPRPEPSVRRYRPFPTETLPEPVRTFVREASAAIGCDPSYVALPLLAGLASAIGNTRRIQLKPGWSEPSIVWTAIVGDSGTMKSPALELALRPVRDRQHLAMKEHAKAMEQFESELKRYERDLAQWKRARQGSADPPTAPKRPVADRCWCDDSTIEAVAELLANQPRGLLLVRDELAGWIGAFDRYAKTQGGDVPKWLEMFGGRPIIVDRKTNDPLYVPRAAVSITGGIQPKILKRVLTQEYRENGLAARLLLAWPPRRPKRWSEAEIAPSTFAAVAAVFERLYSLEFGGTGCGGERQPVLMGLTPEAKKAWVRFHDEHSEEQMDLAADLAAAWSKLEAYAARLALIVHLVRWAAQDESLKTPHAVDETSMRMGIELARWFGHEARRIYAMLDESEEESELRQLIEWIERRGGCVTVRDLTRGLRRYRGSPVAAKEALDQLVGAGYGRWAYPPPQKRGGRPAQRFELFTSDAGVETLDAGFTPGASGSGHARDSRSGTEEWAEL